MCILNISSRGMLLQAASPPPRGSYLEIRRSAFVIIAKVMWTRNHRFGVRSQDVLPVDAIIADAVVPIVGEGVRVGERRAGARPKLATEQRSRHHGRMMEYGFIVTLAMAGAGFAATEVHALLAGPADAVTAALSGTERQVDRSASR